MKWWWCPLSTRPPRREATHILILVCGLTWLVFEPTIYHTGCEYANHIRPMLEPTIYHTGCEHANHTRPMLEPTIYHTQYQHANHTRKVFEPTIYHSGCNHANHTRPMLEPTTYNSGCEHANHTHQCSNPRSTALGTQCIRLKFQHVFTVRYSALSVLAKSPSMSSPYVTLHSVS